MVRVCNITRPNRRERELCVLRQAGGLSADKVVAFHTFVEEALAREARFDFLCPFVFYSSRISRQILPAPRSKDAL